MKYSAVFDPGAGNEIKGYFSGQTYTNVTGFGSTVNVIISAVFVIAGLAFLITFIMGAFGYVTSSGDEKQLDKAKRTMTSAFIGFLILAVSFLVVSLVDQIFGIDIKGLNFEGL